MPLRPILALAALLALAAPVHADYSATVPGSRPVAGDGKPVRQPRFLDEFKIRTIRCKTPIQLEIEIDRGQRSPDIQVTIDGNLQNLITASLNDRVLTIDSAGSWTTGNQPVVRIVLATFDVLDLQGSANAVVRGLDGSALNAIVGAGELEGSGSVANLDLTVNGPGDARLQDLDVNDADVTIDGNGSATVKAERSLEINIRGGGTVHFRGDPELDQKISGGGRVIHD